MLLCDVSDFSDSNLSHANRLLKKTSVVTRVSSNSFFSPSGKFTIRTASRMPKVLFFSKTQTHVWNIAHIKPPKQKSRKQNHNASKFCVKCCQIYKE